MKLHLPLPSIILAAGIALCLNAANAIGQDSVPLYMRPSPLLRADPAKAREIALDALRRLGQARSTARPQELPRLQEQLIRLMQAQVLAGDSAGYTQSAILYVDLERQATRKDALSEDGNSGLNALIRIFRRAGDERLLRAFVNAQIQYLSAALEFDIWAKVNGNALRADASSDRDLASRIEADLQSQPVPRCNMASFLREIGRPRAAAILINNGGARFVRQDLCVTAAEVLAEVGDIPRALQYAQVFIEGMGNRQGIENARARTLKNLVLALTESGRHDDVVKLLPQISKDSSAFHDAYPAHAMGLLQSGRARESAQAYLAYPYRDDVLRWLIACGVERTGDRQAADEVYRKPAPNLHWPGCTSSDPELSESHHRRLAISGDLDTARKRAVELAMSDLPSQKLLLEARNLIDVAFIAAGDIGMYDDFVRRRR